MIPAVAFSDVAVTSLVYCESEENYNIFRYV